MKLLLLVLISISLVEANPSTAGSWRVEQDGSGDFLTLQPAVDTAASGDTIFIGPGWYQDLVEGPQGISYLARWTAGKDLAFIGENVGSVILGPSSYAPISFGPIGIYSDTDESSNIVVKGITLRNLRTGIVGYGDLTVTDCRFETGDTGIVYLGVGSAVIQNCNFDSFFNSCVLKNYDSAQVVNCELGRGLVHFEDVKNGDITRCNASGGALASYIKSTGTISESSADSPSGTCVVADSGSSLLIDDSTLESGENCIIASRAGTRVVVENSTLRGGTFAAIVAQDHASFVAKGCDIIRHFIGENVVYAWGYTNESLEYEIDVSGNYWGNVGPNAFYIDDYIWDQNDDLNNKIIVKYSPVEGGPVPTEGTNWGSVKAMFR